MMTFCCAEQWLEHPGTVGKPLPEADLRIVDSKGGDVPTGIVGEVVRWVKGNPDFAYHNDDQKRRNSFYGSRFATGDLGYLNDSGFLFLCDRVKDMLICGGVNIYPAEIEMVLSRMPGLQNCAVFGIPDAEFGESLCAVIRPVEGSEIHETDVTTYLKERIAAYKIPKTI